MHADNSLRRAVELGRRIREDREAHEARLVDIERNIAHLRVAEGAAQRAIANLRSHGGTP